MDLHKRIAGVLGWTLADVRSFSLLTLRALLQDRDPKLAREISEFIRSGGVLRMLQ